MSIRYKIKEGDSRDLADVKSFITLLSNLDSHQNDTLRDYFSGSDDIYIARAPGRLDVMGGIADYSGSLVLEMPIREATLTAVTLTGEPVVEIISLPPSRDENVKHFSMPVSDFIQNGEPISYKKANEYFESRDAVWAAYIAGAFLVLMREKSVKFHSGAKILIDSDVPEGKGVSSSAALEVSVMTALVAAFDLSIDAAEIAALCQMVENLIVSAPCGIMDQMTSVFGSESSLMSLLCQPAELKDPVTIPDGLAFWGIDSDIRHAVSGADYGTVRTAAFMGYRILAAKHGFEIEDSSGRLEIRDPIWNGYLANISPAEYEQYYRQFLPENMQGKDFLKTYDHITDPVTSVTQDVEYPVRVATEHPIYESFRVRLFSQLLQGDLTRERLILLGELMYQSHSSYSACGLGSEGTDRLVHMVRSFGPENGLYGAKITGGGSGGTVAILGKRDAGDKIYEIADIYEKETDRTAKVFSGSSMGAKQFESVTIQRGGSGN
ncbi:MAG: GHMP kinase [Candidatus Marinimicrobia bacterium]|nr:GHMP kinase [Candidatus Neomarinimicrobiota bacterium]